MPSCGRLLRENENYRPLYAVLHKRLEWQAEAVFAFLSKNPPRPPSTWNVSRTIIFQIETIFVSQPNKPQGVCRPCNHSLISLLIFYYAENNVCPCQLGLVPSSFLHTYPTIVWCWALRSGQITGFSFSSCKHYLSSHNSRGKSCPHYVICSMEAIKQQARPVKTH